MAFVRCGLCQPAGIELLPARADRPRWVTRCVACGGSGADYEKTRISTAIPEAEKTYPAPLPSVYSDPEVR